MSSTPRFDSPGTIPSLRFRYALVALGAVVAAGTAGFHLIERWSIVDSLYMTVLTVTTVGYGEVHPLDQNGKLFAIVLMFAGVGTVAYALSATVRAVVHSEMLAAAGQRRRSREMKSLDHHFIICGAGRVGSRILREVQRSGSRCVVIEQNAAKIADMTVRGVNVLRGDATLEETLREAGVARAQGLVACLPDDADNLYVVLTARGLNPDLHIVARAVEEQAEPKLRRAGANRIVAPIIIGSHRMAQALMRPAVAEMLDSIGTEKLDIAFEQVEIGEGSVYAGSRIRDTNIRAELDILVIGMRHRNGEMLYHPAGDVVLESGDLLIVTGREASLEVMTRLARAAQC